MPKDAVEQDEAVAEAKVSTSWLVRICLAAWLIPGAGHFWLGRRYRALVLFAAILGMFLFGLAMQGQFFSFRSESYLRALGFFAEMCVGVAMPAAMFLGYSGGDPYFVSSDYGTAFLVSAGMLNVLTLFDAYDIAMGRKG
jgi:hypothetical protein